MKPRRHLGIALALVALSGTTARAITTVALSGDAAPGTPAGVVFDRLGFFDSEDFELIVHAQINAAGQVRFIPTLAGPGVGVTNDSGVWGFDPSTGTALGLRDGDSAPGLPAGTLHFVAWAQTVRSALASDGGSAFDGSINGGPAGNVSGVFRTNVAGGAERLLFNGDPAPGLPGVFIAATPTISTAGPTLPASASSDDTWLHARLTGAGVDTINDEAIFGPDGAGGLTLVLRSGTLLPPATQVHTFNVVAAQAGCLAFQAPIIDPPSITEYALWRSDGGGVSLLARMGFPAPGIPGVLFGYQLFDLELNADCRAVFATRLQGSVTNANDDVIYLSDGPGHMVPLVREGDPAPNLPGVVMAPGLLGERALNGAGEVAFRATLSGPGVTSANDLAAYRADGSAIEFVAREGDPIANAPATELLVIRDPLLDDLGRFVFSARLRDTTTPRNYDAIVVAPRNGKLYELVGDGEILEVAPADFREIDHLDYGPRTDGPSPVVSVSGKVLFHATFTDGSDGLFVRDVAEIVGPLPDCDDGLDNDGDGLVDEAADPGCETVASTVENPKCDDDIDNDGDGNIDWDGGSGAGTPDPQCAANPWKNKEAPNTCGLGAELALALAAIGARRRNRR